MNKESLRIVFMGTPDFGIPCLDMLYSEHYNVLAVVTQPDRPSGRGEKISFSPVKEWALKHNIKVLQYERISTEGVEDLKKLGPHLCITAAFGQILSREILDIPEYGIFNVHASLLPKYRGSAPIQWSIINGEKVTGVTIMRTVEKLDAGDIIRQDKVYITDDMDAGILYDKLSILGARSLQYVLHDFLNESLVFTGQPESESSYFPMMKKGFGQIDFKLAGKDVVNFIRGTEPYPGSFFVINDIKVKVHKAVSEKCMHQYKPGTIVACDSDKGFRIAVADGFLNVIEIQMPGKRKMPIEAFLLGNHFNTGDIIG